MTRTISILLRNCKNCLKKNKPRKVKRTLINENDILYLKIWDFCTLGLSSWCILGKIVETRQVAFRNAGYLCLKAYGNLFFFSCQNRYWSGVLKAKDVSLFTTATIKPATIDFSEEYLHQGRVLGEQLASIYSGAYMMGGHEIPNSILIKCREVSVVDLLDCHSLPNTYT
jgi:hypothetical protein